MDGSPADTARPARSAAPEPVERYAADRLAVEVHRQAVDAGSAAAAVIADVTRRAVERCGSARIAFASAPSQDDMLAALAACPDVDWSAVTAFHIDEYVGLPRDDEHSFARYLDIHLFDQVRPGAVHYIDGLRDPEDECRRYAALLAEAPIDVCCLGIGENGHLAFNDPPLARFDDPEPVRQVALDVASRCQQVNDELWTSLDDVPTHAITLTIPALLAATQVVCTVPGERKRAAVGRALDGPVDAAVPASALRDHPSARLFLDSAARPEGSR